MKDIISSSELSSYFILFGSSVGDPITNLRLQKILYYSQAWHLAINKKPLFNDDFEAWVHGPVIRRLYGVYKGYGYNPIVTLEGEEHVEKELKKMKKDFGEELVDFLEDIIVEYFKFAAFELEQMVHKEDPWIKARVGLPPDELCINIIKKEWMRDYYSKFLMEN